MTRFVALALSATAVACCPTGALEADFIVATNDAPAFERGGLALVFDADLIGIAHYIAAFRVRVGIVFGFAHAIGAFFVGIAHRTATFCARVAVAFGRTHVIDAFFVGIAHRITAFRARVGIVFGFAHAIDAFFVGIAHRITACRARIAARDIGNHVVVAPAPRQN